ncbi:MAG: hypothetical protein N3A38_09140 [Planctomycetota bacterium]|nr:hypothetical protein [Planctomycetota bacterium]
MNGKPKRYRYFNQCPVKGSRDLVIFKHMLGVLIPAKCEKCRHQFEADCAIIGYTNTHKRLDYGFCGIEGDTSPIRVEWHPIPIPAKCKDCPHLDRRSASAGCRCNKDKPENVFSGRGLDYGDYDLAPFPGAGGWYPPLGVEIEDDD